MASETVMGSSMAELLDDVEGIDPALFVNQSTAEKFECPICTCISRDPVETEPCGHLYCKSCLESYLECSLDELNDKCKNGCNSEHICPSCRTVIESSSQSKWVMRQVNNLRIKCPNNEAGCQWQSELSNLKTHIINQCEYIAVICKYCQEYNNNNNNNNKNDEKCNIETKFYRKDIDSHYEKCLYFPMKCKLCDMTIRRMNIKEHELNQCIMRQIECPQKCNKKIIAKNVTSHIKNKCENTLVECPYSIYGCNINKKQRKIERKELKKHMFDLKYQMLHLQLKNLYLERLIKSPELLHLDNPSGKYPEIGGIYRRESKPHNGYACYRHDMNITFMIRFDIGLKQWIVDCSQFSGNKIVAIRANGGGRQYVSPTSKDVESGESEWIDEMLIDANGDNDEKEANFAKIYPTPSNQNKENTFSVYSGSVTVANGNKINGHKSNEKNNKNDENEKNIEIKENGKWYINGLSKNGEIEITGYSQKEWDLEWELTRIMAKSNKPEPREIEISCVCGCGRELEETTVASAYPDHANGISCSVCECKLKNGLFHCRSKSNMYHLNGYDLCLPCAEARSKTQDLKAPQCPKCNKTMIPIFAGKAYGFSPIIRCNGLKNKQCDKEMQGHEVAWHCPKKQCKEHQHGFDLCLKCGAEAAKRSLLPFPFPGW